MSDMESGSKNEVLVAASEELADFYEADELAYLLALESETDFRKRESLGRILEIGPRYPGMEQKFVDLYNGLRKAKEARAKLDETEPDKLARPIIFSFLTQLDESEYTKSLLQDVLASRLSNPVTPSSGSIERELSEMKKELNVPSPSKLTTRSIMEKILAGNLRIGEVKPV